MTASREFGLVAACTLDWGIGKDGTIPWKLQQDLKRFTRITTGSIVIMGRTTYQSLPQKFRPLPNRVSIVITTRVDEMRNQVPPVVHLVRTFQEALDCAWSLSETQPIFAIGGARVYACAMHHALCTQLHMTHLYQPGIECDTFMPPICRKTYEIELVDGAPVVDTESGLTYQFLTYHRRHEEMQYLDIVRETLDTGARMNNRTGVDAIATFGKKMSFSLHGNRIPLLTTKRVFYRGVVEELLWFMRGSTDVEELKSKNITIWNEDYERGLKRGIKSGLGPIYAHQWRHAGSTYVDCKTDYAGQGFDQLADILHKLKTNPTDRRMLLCSWNVAQLDQMALPPCHVLYQCYVEDGKYLSGLLYQRSADIGLGLPFNIASYAILTRLFAHLSGLTAHTFHWVGGNTHVYENHVKELCEQLVRKPKRPFPELEITCDPNTPFEEMKYEHFVLKNYHPDAAINMTLNTGLYLEEQEQPTSENMCFKKQRT